MITVCVRLKLGVRLVYILSVCSDRDLLLSADSQTFVGVQIRYHVLIWLGQSRSPQETVQALVYSTYSSVFFLL